MANSMAANLSRSIYRSLLFNPKIPQLSMPFCTTISSSAESSDSDSDSFPDPASSQSSTTSKSAEDSKPRGQLYDRPLENGLDIGIYKAILVGQVGQTPVQKTLKNGNSITMFSVGTGGIRNNRRPRENEEPVEYANRSVVQWHRICVYPQLLGGIVMKNALPGTIVYLEGNLESTIFTDPVTGMARRLREVAIRQRGRIVFLGNVDNDQGETTGGELKGAGFY